MPKSDRTQAHPYEAPLSLLIGKKVAISLTYWVLMPDRRSSSVKIGIEAFTDYFESTAAG